MGSERCSSFFFIGRFEPAELANFNVQNVFLRDRRGGVVEVFGGSIAVWWPSRIQEEFKDHRDSAGRWFVAIAGSYFLESDVALTPKLTSWVEALDVETREAVIGIAEARFPQVEVVREDDAVNSPMRRAIATARRVYGGGEIEQAVAEMLRAGSDSSPQALLSAYRALECIRRIYEPSWPKRKEGWRRMAQDLGFKPADQFDLLAKAAQAVRHGEVPTSARRSHVVNRAQRNREALLKLAHDLVRDAVAKHA